jgi:hypothetical protein
MLKNIIVFLLFTATTFAHADGSDHWHLLGFLHSSEFGFLVVICVALYALYRYMEKENV